MAHDGYYSEEEEGNFFPSCLLFRKGAEDDVSFVCRDVIILVG